MSLDEDAAKSITDSSGFVSREDFMKFAKETKLVDFGDRKDKEDSPAKEWAPAKIGGKVLKRVGNNFLESQLQFSYDHWVSLVLYRSDNIINQKFKINRRAHWALEQVDVILQPKLAIIEQKR